MLLWSGLPQISVPAKGFADSRHGDRKTPQELMPQRATPSYPATANGFPEQKPTSAKIHHVLEKPESFLEPSYLGLYPNNQA